MPKISYLIIFFLILFLLIFIFFPSKPKYLRQQISTQNYNLEIANTPTLQAKGLSGRQELCSNCGMLFIFKKERTQIFWMKETLIPLDIIFIDKNFLITDIFTANPEPGIKDFQLKLYQSSRPSLYVIEINAGQADSLGLKTGDRLNLNL